METTRTQIINTGQRKITLIVKSRFLDKGPYNGHSKMASKGHFSYNHVHFKLVGVNLVFNPPRLSKLSQYLSI